MTKEFEYLLYLFSCGARGIKAANPENGLSWDRILSLAKEHSVYHTALYGIKLMDNCSLPEQKRAQLLSTLKCDVLSSFSRQIKVMGLLRAFEAAGIRVALLKGYAVATLYALPYARISGDVDLYVDPKDEKKATRLLKQQGFVIHSRDNRSHHVICDHPEIGHLELHHLLYDEIIEDLWFKKRQLGGFLAEDFAYITAAEGTYYTFGKTDTLLFLALHLIKHFIESGISMRAMMDFLLYYFQYSDEVDLVRFWETMDRLHYSYIINILLRISTEYFKFPNRLPTSTTEVCKEDVMALLNDLETGGWLGQKEDGRPQGWYMYNRIQLLDGKRNSGYWAYMLRWNSRGYFKELFPQKSKLVARFPYEQNSMLVPLAWLHRLLVRGVPYLLKGGLMSATVSDSTNLNEPAEKRVELFKQVKII